MKTTMGPLAGALALAISWTSPLVAETAAGARMPEPGGAIDLVMSDARIRTPSGWVQAMALRDGVIVALGDSATIGKLGGKDTRRLDLAGATVLPGLHDSHVHALFAGLEQFSCALEPGASPQAIAAAVKACAAQSKAGDWIEGGNWVAAVFAPGQQNKGFLDAIAPRNPIILNDESHHSVWVNSRALALAGITRDTPDPEGGIIERDAAGEPTGLLRENATSIVERIVPEPDEARKREALILSTSQMLAYGITSFTDATVRTNNIGTMAALSGEGLIKQRVRGCIVWVPGPEEFNRVSEALIAERASYARPRFATDCVKIFLDGVPTESHTAAMLEPYEDAAKGGTDGTSRNRHADDPPGSAEPRGSQFRSTGSADKVSCRR